MKKYYWLKLKEDFFKSKEIKKLRTIAGGDTYTIIYLKLQLLSLKDEGKLYFDGIEDEFYLELALELDENPDNVKITIMYLEKHGFIETITENEYLLSQVLTSIGKETDSAERVRRHRNKKSQPIDFKNNNHKEPLHCNANVTDRKLNSNANETNSNTEIERDREREREKKEKRESNSPPQKNIKEDMPKKTKTEKPKETYCPDNFPISEQMKQYAESKGYKGNIADETEKFLLHHKAKGTKFVDWYAAWQQWIRRAIEYSKDKPMQSNTMVQPKKSEIKFIEPASKDDDWYAGTEGFCVAGRDC